MSDKSLEKVIGDMSNLVQLLRRDIDKFRTDFFEIKIKIDKMERKQNETNKT
jgi:hypothetical protein